MHRVGKKQKLYKTKIICISKNVLLIQLYNINFQKRKQKVTQVLKKKWFEKKLYERNKNFKN